MANREKGEFDIQIAGKTYTLVMNTNAMAELQDVLSTGDGIVKLQSIYEAVSGGSVKHVRAFLWATLRKYHREVTLEQAGDLIDAAGGRIAEALQNVNERATPDPSDIRELDSGNPQRAQDEAEASTMRGRGGRSTSTRAKSA